MSRPHWKLEHFNRCVGHLFVSSYQLSFVYYKNISSNMSTNSHVKLRNQITLMCKKDEETMRFSDKRADVYKARHLIINILHY